MGGHRVGDQGPDDDGYDEEGYDESQRAEILEATTEGPSDGNLLTDLVPDMGDADVDDEDGLDMESDELGEEDDDAEQSDEAIAEDELQEEFEDDDLEDDDDLDDRDEDALEP
ncbi:DNA primase [Sphingomonas sp.]|uniref:DNA primase n=1 Tax=Sphingomonas sp. TaxID=28214 RepID=UPI001AFDB366|nr:DNA primase [Sphingomonas sp.]MBO9714451.1 DNA primase [Sphingomonas sp.]